MIENDFYLQSKIFKDTPLLLTCFLLNWTKICPMGSCRFTPISCR